ncbi:MAG TPA: BamA/TamA family outer membrane protein [Flavisolibacter sp.]|jgi:outer membrane protein assembly factor BamA
MAKLNHLLTAILFLTLCCGAGAQSYTVYYKGEGTDTAGLAQKAGLTTSFLSRREANIYLAELPSLLQGKGYITASIDSLHMDSAAAVVQLYLGEQYRWARIHTLPADDEALNAVRWPGRGLSGAAVDFSQVEAGQQKLLDYFEEKGYPFARIFLDSISINGPEVTATLRINQGPLYRIDSIRLYGDAKVSNDFLQRYLGIANGSVYNKKKLDMISKKLAELSYVTEERPSDLTLLGTGSVLNLYLKQRKSSQFNLLIGFLPNSDASAGRKFMITGEVNGLLRNAFGAGEILSLNWQQLQQKSPRLNILYEQPYVFRSPFGINFTFDMFRKDSTFLNIIMNLGTSYRIEERQSVAVFIQRRQTIVNNVNTAQILQSKQLPQDADVSSLNLGVSYRFNNTDYRLNPRKGYDLFLTGSGGNKKIRKNAQILELKDPGNPAYDFESLYDTVKLNAYQVRLAGSASWFLPIGRQSAFRLGAQAGLYQSANYFRNELFQIGGYRTLRGFDEESQFVSSYVIGTAEYRYLIGPNSNFFAFVDAGRGNHLLESAGHGYLGTGLGLSLETKAGIFNLVWAVGKRDDTEINLRQSKVHLGFVNYF